MQKVPPKGHFLFITAVKHYFLMNLLWVASVVFDMIPLPVGRLFIDNCSVFCTAFMKRITLPFALYMFSAMPLT